MMMNHPSGPDEGSEPGEGDVAVALDTLATGDGVTPEVGDNVDVQVSGKVSRIEGNCAYVTPETCNGQPPPHMADEAMSGESLRQQAQAADESYS